jgi:multidrug efflux pump subunit AcrA (membrane-fusion protein)
LAQLRNTDESRPNPDPTLLTTVQLDREIGHLKELMEQARLAQEQALQVALAQMNRRLEDLNELRKAVETDRVEFVRVDVYQPAHEELRRQHVSDNQRIIEMGGEIKTNATDLAELKSSMMWLSRLVIGALILAIVTYAFQRLTGR